MLIILFLCFSFVLAFYLGQILSERGYTLPQLNSSRPFVWGHICVIVLLLAGSAVLSESLDFVPLSFYPYLPYLFWFVLNLVFIYLWGLYLGLFVSQSTEIRLSALSIQNLKLLAVMFFGLVSLIMMKSAEYYLTSPIPAYEIKVRLGPENSILQSTRVTCIPAALANILPYFGLKCTEQECAKAVNTTRFGTRESDLILGLAQWGLNGERVSVLPEQLKKNQSPVIVKIWKGFAKHALAVLGTDDEGYILLIDPSIGPLRMSPDFYRNALVDGKGVRIIKGKL